MIRHFVEASYIRMIDGSTQRVGGTQTAVNTNRVISELDVECRSDW